MLNNNEDLNELLCVNKLKFIQHFIFISIYFTHLSTNQKYENYGKKFI
jgi:hypothetical protein